MKALILGGTGAIGTELINILAKQGWALSVTSRSPRRSESQITFIIGNAMNLPFLRQILQEQWDVIIDFMVYSTLEFRERAELFLRSTSQYIFLSSARVYAASDKAITEQSPRLLDICNDREYLATDEYALAKARQEDILEESKSRNWTIIRPYITYGPSRLQLGILEKEEWLYRALRGRTIVASAVTASHLTTLTHGLDVAGGIAALTGNSRTLGETYQITCSTSISWKKALGLYSEVLSECLGVEPKILELDTSQFLSIFPRKYQLIYDRHFDRVFDSKKIHEHTSIQMFTEPETGLKEALRQFLTTSAFLSINWPVEAKNDFLTGEVASVSEIARTGTYAKYFACRYLRPLKHTLTKRKTS